MNRTLSIVTIGILGVITLMTISATRTPGSPIASTGQAKSLDDWKRETQTMVAMIDCAILGKPQYGAGIIFGVDDNADRLYIVTARHVVIDPEGDVRAQTIKVRFNWQPGRVINAQLTDNSDRNLDVAVLYVQGLSKLGAEAASLPFDCLGEVDYINSEDKVHLIGFDGNQELHTSAGLMEGVEANRLNFNAAGLRHGDSGGALTDEKWRLIGITLLDIPPSGQAVRIDKVITRLQGWQYKVRLADRPQEPEKNSMSGVWQGTTSVNGSTDKLTLILNVVNGEVTGTVTTGFGEARIIEGSLNGNRLHLLIKTWDNRLVTLDATLDQGWLTGKSDAALRGRGTWKARKIK